MILDISNRSKSACNLTCAELRKGAAARPLCGTSRWTRNEPQRRQCTQDILNNDFQVHLSNAYLTKGDVPTMAAPLDVRARCIGQSQSTRPGVLLCWLERCFRIVVARLPNATARTLS
jgi:hypothetical protein